MKRLLIFLVLWFNWLCVFSDEVDTWMRQAIEKSKGYPYFEMSVKPLSTPWSWMGSDSNLLITETGFKFGYPFHWGEVGVYLFQLSCESRSSSIGVGYNDFYFNSSGVGINLKYYLR